MTMKTEDTSPFCVGDMVEGNEDGLYVVGVVVKVDGDYLAIDCDTYGMSPDDRRRLHTVYGALKARTGWWVRQDHATLQVEGAAITQDQLDDLFNLEV